jgi:hypothetical protein
MVGDAGLTGDPYKYYVRYMTPKVRGVMPTGWRLDNLVQSKGKLKPKQVLCAAS